MSNKSKKIAAFLIIVTAAICYFFGDLSRPRISNIEERNVVLTDVGTTIKSLKNEKMTSFTGNFIDKKTGNEFTLKISSDEYKNFEQSMKPIEMTKKVALDRVENVSTGTWYILISGFLGSLSLTLFICFFTPFFESLGIANSKEAKIKA